MDDANAKFFNSGVWKALAITIGILVVGELLLAWQYHQLENRRIAKLEVQLEEKSAQDVLEAFLDSRISHNEIKTTRYLTENSNEQKESGEFPFFGEFEDYKIRSKEKTGEGEFRFQVEILQKDTMPSQLEVITLLKILGDYYIDSIELAG